MPDKGRLPPHALEAEKSVLSAILIDPDAIVKIADILSPDSFYDQTHQLIYEAMETLYEKRQPIDVVTVNDQLKKMKKLTQVGGASTLAELSSVASTAANVEHYAKLVRDASIKRRMISLGAQLTDLAFDDSKAVDDVMDVAEQQVFSLSQDQNTRAFLPIKDTLVESFERLDELQKSGDELRGVPTGFADVDHVLAGLQKSNLIILAARPGMGKTTFALNIAHHVAVASKRKVGFFSLEMSREELVDRLLVGQADIDAWRLKTGRLDQQDFLKLSDAMGVLADAHIFIDDTPGMSIFEMRTRARRLMTEHNVDLIMVDYLQLAHGRSKDNRVQEVAEISQGLKNIARELKVPVLALSQLSRAIESRGEKIPQLSDLRESGCLTGDTLITLADTGQQVPIAKLKGKADFAVWSLNLETFRVERALVSNAFATGTKPTYTLTTKLGRIIKATANHKFLTIEGWKRLDELQESECLALPRVLPATGVQTMTDAEIALLGHLLGDGCTLPRHSIQYTTREIDLAETVLSLANTVFGSEVEPRVKKERIWYQVYLRSKRKHTHGVHSPVRDWLVSLKAWGLRSYEKRVPIQIFSQPQTSIALFLRHIWTTDGCIIMRGGKKAYPAIYYASSSHGLIQDLQTLLLRIGINARIKRVSQGIQGRDQYHLIVSGKPDIQTFVSLIGTLGQYKIRELEKIKLWVRDRTGNTNRDIIPAESWNLYIKPAMKEAGITYRQLCDMTNNARSGAMFSQNMGRGRAMKISQAVKSSTLEYLATSDIYWDQVTSIEQTGQEEVFDLTVPGYENFVANNIIVHNSIEQDADVVMFLYRKDDDIREAVNLKIAKHRNGALGDVDLFFRGERVKFYGMESKRPL